MPTDQPDNPPIRPFVVTPGLLTYTRWQLAYARQHHVAHLQIDVPQLEALIELADEALAARAGAKTGEIAR
jgi:hypothetical protein